MSTIARQDLIPSSQVGYFNCQSDSTRSLSTSDKVFAAWQIVGSLREVKVSGEWNSVSEVSHKLGTKEHTHYR